MATYEQAVEIVDSYLRELSDGNIDAVVALYAEDARLEDPVGSQPLQGREAIAKFYGGVTSMGKLQLERTGAVRLAGNELAFPFVCRTQVEGNVTAMEIIDHFVLNADNQIVSMRAFWGAENMV